MRVDSRSIVLESSLTRPHVSRWYTVFGGGLGITVFQNLVEMLQVLHDDVSVLFQDGQRYEQVEAAAEIVGPQCLPQA